MKRWIGIGSVVLGLIISLGCSPSDQDRARREGRDAQEKAQQKLDETRVKLREELKHADAQTREDLDKARDQLHHALSQSEEDADKARERLREHEDREKDKH
jgi:hypothetical protein